MSFSSLASGRITATVPDRIHLPRIWKPHAPIIFMTGGGGTAIDGYAGASGAIDALISDGLRVVMPSVPWLGGNNTADSRITAAITYARTNLGCTSDPPILIGVSNGASCALLYALDHSVAGIVGFLPPVDANYLYETDHLGLRARIEAAWGISYPTPLPLEARMYENAATVNGLPMQLWYASDDEISHNIVSFAALTGADIRNVGPLGHTDAAVIAADSVDVVDFVSNLA